MSISPLRVFPTYTLYPRASSSFSTAVSTMREDFPLPRLFLAWKSPRSQTKAFFSYFSTAFPAMSYLSAMVYCERIFYVLQVFVGLRTGYLHVVARQRVRVLVFPFTRPDELAMRKSRTFCSGSPFATEFLSMMPRSTKSRRKGRPTLPNGHHRRPVRRPTGSHPMSDPSQAPRPMAHKCKDSYADIASTIPSAPCPSRYSLKLNGIIRNET